MVPTNMVLCWMLAKHFTCSGLVYYHLLAYIHILKAVYYHCILLRQNTNVIAESKPLVVNFKASFYCHKITTKTLKWFIILDKNNFVNVSHHYWMPIWAHMYSMLERPSGIGWGGGGGSSYENTPESRTETDKRSSFPYQKVSGRTGDDEWLRMTNAFIVCDLLLIVQTVYREWSFKRTPYLLMLLISIAQMRHIWYVWQSSKCVLQHD